MDFLAGVAQEGEQGVIHLLAMASLFLKLDNLKLVQEKGCHNLLKNFDGSNSVYYDIKVTFSYFVPSDKLHIL